MDKQEYQARVAWLRRYQDALRKQKNLVLRLREAKDAAVNTSPAMSSVRCQNTDGVSATQRAVEMIEDIQLKLLDQEIVTVIFHRETINAILKIKDSKAREVLRMRYLRGKTIQEIALDMHISERWAKNLHRTGIYALNIDSSPSMC